MGLRKFIQTTIREYLKENLDRPQSKYFSNIGLKTSAVVLRSEQLESGLTCMMCRKPKKNDGHTCCEECAGLAF